MIKRQAKCRYHRLVGSNYFKGIYIDVKISFIHIKCYEEIEKMLPII